MCIRYIVWKLRKKQAVHLGKGKEKTNADCVFI